MIFCIAENRQKEQIATKLLILSLQKFCPAIPIHLFFPGISADMREWLKAFPAVHLETNEINHQGWEVKVYALLDLLRKGHRDIWWLDNDLIVTNNFIEKYGALDDDILLITEEALYGNRDDYGLRTKGWGLPIGRIFPFVLNTAVLRVTDHHLSLLEKWSQLLQRDDYLNAQKMNSGVKPAHLFGDQDVLTALLGSEEFANVPVKILKLGDDIIQYFGFSAYTTSERMDHLLHGLPPFIHCQRWKPWHKTMIVTKKDHIQEIYLHLSPYCLEAEKYRSEVKEEMPWLDNIPFISKFFKLIGFRNPALTGLPMAAGIDLVRSAKRLYKK